MDLGLLGLFKYYGYNDEVASLLEISDGNQRLLLHRARARVRDALAGYVGASA